jgi:hypothetical protein
LKLSQVRLRQVLLHQSKIIPVNPEHCDHLWTIVTRKFSAFYMLFSWNQEKASW